MSANEPKFCQNSESVQCRELGPLTKGGFPNKIETQISLLILQKSYDSFAVKNGFYQNAPLRLC